MTQVAPGRGADGAGALFLDLYELTMAASYVANGRTGPATFELSVRSLPARRNFLVACGLADVVPFLERFAFQPDDLAFLDSLGLFTPSFLETLAALRFTGDVFAVPEGEVVFAGEPLVRVTAPLVEGQLVETYLLNAVASSTMVASKAARVALACAGRPFVDFSARRDHGVDAALQAARAAAVAGAAGTSLVEAGRRWGLALSGTMAHSYVLAFPTERDAFRAFVRGSPDGAVLLIDTYDTLIGARTAVAVAQELAAEGGRLAAVRLDSGALGTLAGDVRAILDDGGLPDVRIFASGDLDEDRIAALVAAGAPIDAFGVGTRMGTSHDAPSLGAVYKLVADEHGPKMKRAPDKLTLPEVKQVWRMPGGYDVVALDGEAQPAGRPLLEPVVVGGRAVAPPEPLESAVTRCRAAVAALPDRLRSLEPASPPYEVRWSPGLADLVARLGGERAG